MLTPHAYKLTDLEQKRVNEFREDHDPPFFRWGRCNSYSLTFSHEGGIGVGVSVQCTCGARRDVTDVSCW
jgi:hypothetical protein